MSGERDGVLIHQGNAIAPVVELETAVSHACMPLAPFRCWQYDTRAKAIPTWVLEYLTVQPDGRIEFNAPENGPSCFLDGGDWLVCFDSEEQLVTVYPPDEFARLFRCVFQ